MFSIALNLGVAALLSTLPNFCDGVRIDGQTYKSFIQEQRMNETHGTSWEKEVRKGQVSLCKQESRNW